MGDAPPDNIAGLPTGQKACHKFMIPTAWGVTDTLGKPKMMQQMGFVPCIGANCNLWNSEKESLKGSPNKNGECWDVTRARAMARIADLKWNEVIGSEN